MLTTLMILVTISMLASPTKITATTTPTISIQPPEIKNIEPGSIFSVNATLQNAENVYAWQIKVQFDKTLLNCTGIYTPPTSIFKLEQLAGIVIDNSAGYVMIGYSRMGSVPGKSGSDVLAVITFKVLSRGRCPIEFSKPYGQLTYLLNPDLDVIQPVNLEDGYFDNWIPPPPATLYIYPKRVVDPTLTPGQTFNVNVSIQNATNLNSWKSDILYLKNIINATDVTEGNFLKSIGPTTFNVTIQPNFNTTHALISMSCTLKSGGASGSGVLATLTFKVLDLGETLISISDPYLKDPNGLFLPFNVINGYFNNLLIAKLSIDPSEIRGPEYTPGTTFQINVTIDDVEGLKTCIFNLTYNPTVIMEITINIPPVLGLRPAKKIQIDDLAGYIWIQLTYPSTVTTYTPVTIMTVEFEVVTLGVSPINLTNTQLLNEYGNAVSHEVSNGIFVGLIRNVAVIDVRASPSEVYQGWNVYINITLENKGNITETFTVKAYCDNYLIGEFLVENLEPGTQTVIYVQWNTKNVMPCHRYSISAEAQALPFEIDLTDNVKIDGNVKVCLMGDTNGDGLVDTSDMASVCYAYASYPGTQRWDPHLDLNQDGIIDTKDVVMVAKNYGKHCP
jgi:hypothetical protein